MFYDEHAKIRILDCGAEPELLYDLNGVEFFDNKKSSGIVVSVLNTNDETMIVGINTYTGDIITASQNRFGENFDQIMRTLNLMYGDGYSYNFVRPHESMGYWSGNNKAEIIRNHAI